jgi:hypothetical protein
VVRALLVRGMLCGLAAGVVAAVVAKLLGEGAVGKSIYFESRREAAEGMPAGHEVFSRTVQNTAGLFTGMVLFGIAVGGLFALAYACAQGRLGAAGARASAALVALGAFVGLYLVPILKYPANPPSIGNPDTIGHRTALYFSMIAVAVVVVISVFVAANQLTDRLGRWNAVIVAAVGGLVVVGAAYALLPDVHETPPGFPADVLWRFRIASLAIQASVWAVIGLLFGALTERSYRRAAAAEAPARESLLLP